MHGLRAYPRGITWLRQHPRYLSMLFIPMLIALGAAGLGLAYFFEHDAELLTSLLFAKPESWYGALFYYISYVLVYAAVLVIVGLLTPLLLMNVIASPFYEIVSSAIEREFMGGKGVEMSFFENLAAMVTELKKVVLILSISFIMLFIPVLNVVSALVTAILLGWDFFDYPAARRGWPVRRRLKFMLANVWSVTGFGLWLVIPFVQIILLPFAVAGGTLLSLEAMRERDLLHAKGKN